MALDIALVLISIISSVGLGSVFFRSVLLSLISGLSFSALVVSPLVFVDISLVRPLQIILFFSGLILFMKRIPLKPNKLSSRNYYNKLRKILFNFKSLIFCASLIIIPLILKEFRSREYVFENHDVLYFGWIREIWEAEYTGGVQVPTVWPQKMSAMNTISSVVLSQLSVLGQAPNLESIITTRYIFLCTLFIIVALEYLKLSLWHLLGLAPSLISVFALYGREIFYSLGMSSFWFVVVIFILCLELLNGKNRLNENGLVVMLAILVVSKAQIAHILLTCLIFCFWKIRKRMDRKTLIFVTLSILNLTQLFFLPKSSGANLGFPTLLAFRPTFAGGKVQVNWNEISVSSDLIVDWYLGVEKELIYTLNLDSRAYPMLVFVLILVKVFAPYWLSRKYLFTSKSTISRTIDLYMILSALSVLFVRNGGHVGHQAHAYLLATIVSSTFVLVAITKSQLGKGILYPLTLAWIMTVGNPKELLPYWYQNEGKLRDYPYSSATLPLETNMNEKEILALKQVQYSINGIRLEYDSTGDYKYSQVFKFTIIRD